MSQQLFCTFLSRSLIALALTTLPVGPLFGKDVPTPVGPGVVRLTVEEAKQRALASSNLLSIAALNEEGKAHAIKAAQADYFPKVAGTALLFHFDDDLGKVITTPGRKLTGPRGRTLLNFSSRSIEAAFLNQNSSFSTVSVAQPITDLLKVRQGVKIAQADAAIAAAEAEKGARELASGVEQLFWGLLAARRIQAGSAESVRGAELLAQQAKSLEARTALVEARQGLQAVNKQIADLQEQLSALLGLPLCTTLELVEPPLPLLPYRCVDDVLALAVSNSPEIAQASETIRKAQAAVKAGKLDYVPSVAVVGGYAKQTAADYVQQDFSYVGVVASYTFVDWGKRRNVIRERDTLVAMATLKLKQTEDDIRQKAVKLFREVAETEEALKTAREMAELRKEAVKKATTPEALKNPKDLLEATKANLLADVEAIKAELAYRQAVSVVMSLTGKP